MAQERIRGPMQEQITEGHSIRKLSLALGVSRQTIRKFGGECWKREHEAKPGVAVALAPPHVDTEDLTPWERAIDWAGVCTAVTSGATNESLIDQ